MTQPIDPELDVVLHALEMEESGATPALEDHSKVIAGRYEIVEELGAGGMGRVLHVRHQRLGKPFALKLMQADFSQHPEAEQIFRREAQLASQLSHPNIVETVDFGHDPDWGWFIAMQYLDGEPLSVHIEREGQLPVTIACDIAAQLADALRHSHQKGVVHADVKSENVLCLARADDDRRGPQIKLLDFGTAQFSATHAPSDRATRVTGTPEYLAPERILGGPSQPSNDLYSLGVIIYEMLTGKPPFTGDPGTVLVRHISEAPEPAGARRGEVLDARLDAILEKSLAKDPQQRYASAEDLLADLRGYMDALGLQRRTGVAAPDILVRTGERIDAAVAAFDAMRIPIAGMNRDGTIVVANPSFARLLGGDPGSVIGRDARETFLAQINPELQDDLRVVALNGTVIRRDLTIERAGKTSTLRYMLSPAAGACGHCLLHLYVHYGRLYSRRVLDRIRELASSDRPEDRYSVITTLAESGELEAMRLLVAWLADDRIGESHYSPIHDETVETLVSEAALAALRQHADQAWPAIVEALPTATSKSLIDVLRALKPIARVTLPLAAYDTIIACSDLPAFVFERDLARRLGAGELDLEGVWQLWIRDHPDSRAAGISPLIACAKDHGALAQQLVELLDGDTGYAAAYALGQLPVVLDTLWVRAVAGSKWPERYPILLPALARYGEPAVAAIPTCVAILATGKAGSSGAKLDHAAKALLAFGPLAASVRPQILERFLTVDETAGLHGSLRSLLADVLGRDRLREELHGQLDWLPTDDWYARIRKKEIRQVLGLPPPHLGSV